MRLISLQIFPKGVSGWSSDEFFFGSEITQLFGPNGCGKTPLVQSIVFCLGFPSIFREDIYNHCNYATLKFELGGAGYEVARLFSRDPDINVIDNTGAMQRFFNEREYTDYLFQLFKFRSGNLVSTSNTLGYPYMASLLPIYYLDQDEGYSDFYVPPSKFIKDQFSEMMRVAFDLSIKNSFDEKKDKIKAKEDLDFNDKLVNERSKELALAKSESSLTDDEISNAEQEILLLEAQLQSYKNADVKRDDSVEAIQRIIKNNFKLIYEIEEDIGEIKSRIQSKVKIIDEINIEINTLGLNEDARRVFLSFEEICGAKSCGLFSLSSESYGKNLLYLRDQIKDLERNSKIENDRKLLLTERRDEILRHVTELQDTQISSNEKSDASAMVDAISAIKNQIFSLQIKLADRKKISVLEKRYFDTIIKRDRALDKYESFSSDRSTNPSLIKIRANLRQYFVKWLTVLNTKNISFDISYKDDFTPLLGTESVGQLKGSTKVRAVLAYHAAVVELLAEKEESVFKVLILDTPKQHEINNDDLNKYMKELKRVAKSCGVQIIFSTTEYHYSGDSNDVDWIPKEVGIEQNMFLRMGV